jgi:hypothetical protein
MNKRYFLALLCCVTSAYASASPKVDCQTLLTNLVNKTSEAPKVSPIKNNWTDKQKNEFLLDVGVLGFNADDIKIIIESLNLNNSSVEISRVKDYFNFVLSLNIKDQKIALMDLEQLDSREINSKYIKRFIKDEENVARKIAAKKITTEAGKNRYKNLFYGCKALRPNEINKGAAREFKRFSFSLSLGTLGASYAYYNMDKELNAEWFEKLGYDVGISLLFSYVGGVVQTNANDTQLVKTLKSYYIGRLIGVTDIAIYDPLFNTEHKESLKILADLKKDPNYQEKAAQLMSTYEKRGLYRKYKEEIIGALKKLPSRISLGIKGNSVDENNVDWNNLSRADLDRPEVEEVLVAAAMAQVYQDTKGEWIDTSDAGVDRYFFNAAFYGLQMPRSMAQTFITYKMLCMGQDNPAISFTKAVLFNVTSNFIVNHSLYGFRQKAIGH